MAMVSRKQICPVCGRQIRGDVRIRIKDNIELCKTCSSEIEMDSSMIPNMTVEDIKTHLAYRKENRNKMEQFKMTWGAEAGAYILRADMNSRLWYCTNDRSDRNPPLFAFADLKSAVYLEDGQPAEELETGFKSLFAERTAPTLVQSMKIIIDVDNYYIHQIVDETLAPGTGMTTGTVQYKKNRKDIQDMMDCLRNIQEYAKIPEVVEKPEVEVVSDEEEAQIPEEQVPEISTEETCAAPEPAEAEYTAPEPEPVEVEYTTPEPEPAEAEYTAPEPEPAEAEYTAPEAEPAEAEEAVPEAEPEEGKRRWIRNRNRSDSSDPGQE